MKAITVLLELVASASALMQSAVQVSALITQARAEGRDVSDAELDALTLNDDAARAALDAAIAKANAGG